MKYTYRTRVDHSTDSVFEWHCREGAFERLTPPWDGTKVVSRVGGVNGGRVELDVTIGPFRKRWVAQYQDFIAGRQFRDGQVSGPFAAWVHTHRFDPDNAGGCVMGDEIEYTLPLGILGAMFGSRAVRSRLDRTFRYRHAIVESDLTRHADAGVGPMAIAISGARGLVGSSLMSFLTTGGHRVRELMRSSRPGLKDPILWNPKDATIEAEKLEGLDAVVHLAGEGIAVQRWSAAQKEEIRRSRVAGTRLLSESLAKLTNPPKTLVCASAIGFYGDRESDLLTEGSAPGTDFLSQVCQEWEGATAAAKERGIRVVNVRFGIILTPGGGALAKMLLPFKLGAGGPIGNGEQWMSWVSIEDVVGAIHHALVKPELSGPVNVVAPNPVSNAAFAKVLGRVLRRPAFAPFPALAVELVFGEMGKALLLSSQRVVPEKLQSSGYRFQHPILEDALRFNLGR